MRGSSVKNRTGNQRLNAYWPNSQKLSFEIADQLLGSQLVPVGKIRTDSQKFGGHGNQSLRKEGVSSATLFNQSFLARLSAVALGNRGLRSTGVALRLTGASSGQWAFKLELWAPSSDNCSFLYSGNTLKFTRCALLSVFSYYYNRIVQTYF